MIPRRSILQGGALALASFGLDPLFLARTALAAGVRTKTLVCLFQRGAVDGLSMLVPHGDPEYYAARPGIAVPKPGADGGALDLDGHFGLHPKLAALAPLYKDGRLALVAAVGSPDPTRSHFDAQRTMEAGSVPARATGDGWLSRCLACEKSAANPFRAVAWGAMLPQALAGASDALVLEDLAGFGIRGGPGVRDRVTPAFQSLYEGDTSDPVIHAGREAFDALSTIGSLPDAAAGYPKGPLGKRLSQVAQLLKAGLGTRVVFVDCGGWDTHIQQAGRLPPLLGELGDGLAAFQADLGARMDDVLVLTMSEFGRMVAENGGGGTDHGHGTVMMALGGGVTGGRVLGKWPGLGTAQRFEGRDLAVTTDFRDLFAEAAGRHLGIADFSTVFPGYEIRPGSAPGLFAG
jgi:uncharacterized protein (DUF1501 family)